MLLLIKIMFNKEVVAVQVHQKESQAFQEKLIYSIKIKLNTRIIFNKNYIL